VPPYAYVNFDIIFDRPCRFTKPEGKIKLGRQMRRWEDGIKIYLKGIGCEGVEWIQLAQDMDQSRAIVNAVVNLRVLASQI
jgi:hypothetical protein